MKKVLILIILTVNIASIVRAQEAITLCHTPANEKFVFLSSSKEFRMSHAEPRPYKHQSAVGKMVTFATQDGKDARGYLLSSDVKTDNWIFVFQEWWGLNDHIKREAEAIYNELGNVNVLALDMYDGEVTDSRQEAANLMGKFQQERGIAIIKGAIKFAGLGAKIGTIGWCFGGGQSLQASLIAENQAVACVMYYGMPEENIDRLKRLNCDVLNIWPTQDQWINKTVMDRFETNMKASGKKLIIKAYDADHAFANPSNPKFNSVFTKDAFDNSISFFRERME